MIDRWSCAPVTRVGGIGVVGLLSGGTSIRMVARVRGLVVAWAASVLLVWRGRAAGKAGEGGWDLVLGIEVVGGAGDPSAGPLRR